MNSSIIKKIVALISGCLAIAGLLTSLHFLHGFNTKKTEITQSSLKESQEKVSFTSDQLNYFIQLIKLNANALHEQVQGHKLDDATITTLLKNKSSDIAGLGLAFSDKHEMHAPYYTDQDGTQLLTTLTWLPHQDWFKAALKGQPGYHGAFINESTHTKELAYTQPFSATYNGSAIEGTIFATQTISQLNFLLSNFYLGQKGYWFIVDHAGTIVAHPTSTFIGMNIAEFSKKVDDTSVAASLEKSLHGTQSVVTYNNEITHNPSWLISQPLPENGWVLAGVFDQTQMPIKNTYLRTSHMRIAVTLAIALLLLIIAILLLSTCTKLAIWLASIAASIVLLSCLAYVWYTANQYPNYQDDVVAIQDKSDLFEILENMQAGTKDTAKHQANQFYKWFTYHSLDNKKYVATGFEINDINIISENQIEIVGFIWQRYTPEQKDLTRGFIFPQMASEPTISELSRINDQGTEIILWLVHAQLNQMMNFKNYPFDTKDFHIQLWHKDIDKNIVLIPDLNAYQVITPSALPGLNAAAFLPGWHLTSSFFGYKNSHYTTNFGLYLNGQYGINKELHQFNTPEFHFSITAIRSLISTFSTDLLTIAIILILLFFLVLIFQAIEFHWILSASSSIFFTTIIAQLRLEGKFPGTEFVYLETFYFVIYSILLITLSLMYLYTQVKDHPIFAYKDQILMKALYWPVVLSAFLYISLYYLY